MFLICFKNYVLNILLITKIITSEAYACNWPISDSLFILDSTINVGGPANHRKILDFIADTAKAMLRKSSTERTFFGVDVTRLSSIAVVQFTPEAKYEFGFVEDENFERIERKIENIPYLPCLNPDYCQNNLVSWNTIVEWISNIEEGNRPNIPDVIVLVTSSNYQPPELKTGELLVRPRSPIHVFIVSVGQNMPSEAALKPLQFAATTVHLAVLDFKTLNEMVEPLCESVHSFLAEGHVAVQVRVEVQVEVSVLVDVKTHPPSPTPAAAPTPVIVRTWHRPTPAPTPAHCNEISEPQISFLSGSNCIFCLAIFAIVSLVLLSTLFFLMCRYHQETTTFQSQIRKEKEKFKKQDDYYISKLHEKSNSGRDHEQARIEMINERNQISEHQHEENLNRDASHHKLNVPATSLTRQKGAPSVIVAPAGSAAPGKKKVRETRAEHHFEERRSSDPSNATKEVGGQLTVDTERHLSYNNDEIYHLSDLHTESDDDSLMLEHSMTHLPNEHPALSLPPVDVLLLVDASGSIGNVNFELIKKYLKHFTGGIDIAPGRSRVSTILFANEPQVIFDFNRYYTNRAVRAAIERLPYLGGATFLAKALSFAAGFLWQEQNMKQVKHKHRFMPTPRHDRLQVMILVSDGVSDDDFDQQATHLHEKMLVKIAAVVTKTFNKERLRPITRYDGAIFMLSEKEALSIWLWNSQKMWNENFGHYIEREKSFNAAEKSFNLNNTRNNVGEHTNSFLTTSNREAKPFSHGASPSKQQNSKEVIRSTDVVNEDSV